MKKTILATFALYAFGTAVALTPRSFLEDIAIQGNWYGRDDVDFCQNIAKNARSSMYPVDSTSRLKYITTIQFVSEKTAKETHSDLDRIAGLKPVQVWQNVQQAYSRLYVAPSKTVGYAYNFNLVDTLDDNGFTGESLVCVSVIVPMQKP